MLVPMCRAIIIVPLFLVCLLTLNVAAWGALSDTDIDHEWWHDVSQDLPLSFDPAFDHPGEAQVSLRLFSRWR